MRASTSRFVYCLGLLVVTACALLPEAIPGAVATGGARAVPLTTEVRLAHAIRGRVELTAVATPDDPTVRQAVATETALRDLAFADDAVATRRDLIYALTDELSDALSDREQISARHDDAHPERVKADAVVLGLTAAINSEVHRNRI
jgi:hypothetical protein